MRFEVAGNHTTGGVVIRPVRGCRITFPLPRRAREKEDSVEEEGGSDTDEEDVSVLKPKPDCEESGDDVSHSSAVADADVDSVIEECGGGGESSSDCSSSGSHGAPTDVGRQAPATSHASSTTRSGDQGRPHLWDNGYFYIVEKTGTDETVKIVMHSCWMHAPPGGMGPKKRSRTLTPQHYGETRACPARSTLLLHAWMWWRSAANGWADAERGRHRQFKEEAESVELGIRRLQPQPGRLLGNASAGALLKLWVPVIVGKLRA